MFSFISFIGRLLFGWCFYFYSFFLFVCMSVPKVFGFMHSFAAKDAKSQPANKFYNPINSSLRDINWLDDCSLHLTVSLRLFILIRLSMDFCFNLSLKLLLLFSLLQNMWLQLMCAHWLCMCIIYCWYGSACTNVIVFVCAHFPSNKPEILSGASSMQWSINCIKWIIDSNFLTIFILFISWQLSMSVCFVLIWFDFCFFIFSPHLLIDCLHSCLTIDLLHIDRRAIDFKVFECVTCHRTEPVIKDIFWFRLDLLFFYEFI